MDLRDGADPSKFLPYLLSSDEQRQMAEASINSGVHVQVTAGEEDALDGMMTLLSLSGQQAHRSSPVKGSPTVQLGRHRPESCKPENCKTQPDLSHSTKTVLTDLPREIRDRIYFWTLRPDCGLGWDRCTKNYEHLYNGIGTTKILCLNRQIYAEAIGLLHAIEIKLVLRNDGGKMYRNMFAFGKPTFFSMGTRTSRCSIPQQFCELNLVGLRHLAITFKYPLPGRGQFIHPQHSEVIDIPRSEEFERCMSGLMTSARETEAVLWKCTSLQTLRLVLQTQEKTYSIDSNVTDWREYVAITEEDHPEMVELLSLFLNAAKCKKFKTAAEEDKSFRVYQRMSAEGNYLSDCTIKSYTDPLAEQYDRRAEEIGVRATFDRTLPKRYVKFEHESDVPRAFTFVWYGAENEPGAIFEDEIDNSDNDPELAYQEDEDQESEDADTQQQNCVKSAPLPPSPQMFPVLSLDNLQEDLPSLPISHVTPVSRPRLRVYANTDAPEPFRLRPECRKCYELFASTEGLRHHLEAFPKHRMPFKRKAYNTLHYSAQHSGHRKCWTCAKSYVSMNFLNAHLDKYRHRREGMIPRWKQDNGWTNRRDGARNARKQARKLKMEAEWQGMCG